MDTPYTVGLFQLSDACSRQTGDLQHPVSSSVTRLTIMGLLSQLARKRVLYIAPGHTQGTSTKQRAAYSAIDSFQTLTLPHFFQFLKVFL